MTIIADAAAIAEIGQTLKSILDQHRATAPETLLNRREVAEILGLDYKAVRRLVQFGSITTTTDGRFIPRGAVDIYLNMKRGQR